jgi:hypothetical protein
MQPKPMRTLTVITATKLQPRVPFAVFTRGDPGRGVREVLASGRRHEFFCIEDLGVLETGDFLPRAAFSAVPFHK